MRPIHTFKMQLPVPGTLEMTSTVACDDHVVDVVRESVPAADPALTLGQVARAAAAPTRDDMCCTRAHQWVEYAMKELARLGDHGRTLTEQELEEINHVITVSAQHLQMLRQEAETGTSAETKKLIDDNLSHLQSAYSIYSQIPFGQYRAKFFNAVYQRFTIINAEKENLSAYTRNASRVGGNVPDFDMPNAGGGGGASPAQPSQAPPMPMGPNMAGSMQSPGSTMTMPGMPMPIPYAGMPMPGMPYPFPQPGVPIAGMPPLMPMQHLMGMPAAYPSTGYAGNPTGPYPHPTSTPIPVTIPGLQRAA